MYQLTGGSVNRNDIKSNRTLPIMFINIMVGSLDYLIHLRLIYRFFRIPESQLAPCLNLYKNEYIIFPSYQVNLRSSVSKILRKYMVAILLQIGRCLELSLYTRLSVILLHISSYLCTVNISPKNTSVNFKVNKKVKLVDLGTIDYKKAWDYQTALFDEVVALKISNRKLPEPEQVLTPNYLILCEHPHVYTLGKSGSEDHLLINNDELKKKDATYYKINRGGDITYHGPGQIVGYPILDLDNFFTDIHKYLRLLEEAIILTLHQFGIQAGRIDGLTGVWVDYTDNNKARKICAMGVKSSRWVTMHGFAFNINTDLNYFKNIVPCGIEDKAVTSLENELGERQNIEEIKSILKNNLASLFKMELF